MSKLTWVHLSDLHFGKNETDSYEQEYVVKSLAQDISKQMQEHNLCIDFIFFTGDITFNGSRTSFNKAYEYICLLAKSANVALENVIFVPGNHDIVRSNTVEALPMPKTNKEVSALIGNSAELEIYTSGLENYKEFVKKVNGYERYSNELFCTLNRNVGGKVVSIMALNTAWLAAKNINMGEAVLGERQVREALKNVDDADVIITLMHHPFSWLSEIDNRTSKGLLEKRSDFILNGHIHRADLIGKLSIFGNAFNMSAGAIYGDDAENINAYNILSCDLDTGVGNIFFRQYIDRDGGFWSVDNSIDSDITNGIVTFELPSRIPIQKAEVQNSFTPTLQNQINDINKIAEITLPRIPQSIINDIKDGKCVLFAGAGVSVDAGLPMWRELLQNMIEELDNRIILSDDIKIELQSLLNEGRNLIVAEYCRSRLGERLFSDFINNSLKTKNRRSTLHETLSSIPFSAILTTNYDNFLEKYRQNIRVVLPEELSILGYQGIRRIAEESIPIVKLHGSFDNPQSIIFSDSDYRKALYSSPDYRSAISELLEDKSCLFIGFSLVDNNILAFLQSIFEKKNNRAKRHYAILHKAGEVIKFYNEQCLNITTINLDDYSQLKPLLEKLSEEIRCE